jgi:dolichyldiphosphatase
MGTRFVVVRLFRMRDLVVEEDLCRVWWEKWEGKRIATTNGKKGR